MPTNLMGLSPQEINQISAGRRTTEAGQLRQLQDMISALGERKTSNIAQQKLDLAKEKFEYEKNPPMIQMKTAEGNIYEVSKAAQVEGIKAKAYVDNLYQKGQMDKGKYDAWMRPVMISVPDGAGGWIPYEVPSGMLQETAAATKNLQGMRVSAAEETRRRDAFEALGGRKMGDIRDVDMATLLGIRPEAMSTMITEEGKRQAVVKTAGPAGLKPEEHRKLVADHEKTAEKLVYPKKKGRSISDASIQSYNERSRTLNFPSMIYRAEEPTSFLGLSTGTESKPVEVKLPIAGGVQMTPEDVYTTAKRKGISVSQRLLEIQEGMRLIEKARQLGRR